MSWWGPYVGSPFVDGGRDIEGLDCWGLVRLAFADHLGIELPDYGEVSARDLLRVARAIGGGQEAWEAVEHPRAFDVALLRLYSRSWIGHVGLMIDARHMLHTERASAAAVVQLDHYTVRDRLAGFRRYAR